MFCFEHEGQVYCPFVLMFGNALGPFFFSKISKPISSFFRALLIRCMSYVDDWLFAEHKDKADRTAIFTLGILRMLGWSINDKGQTIPLVTAPFLGMGLHAKKHWFYVLEEKVIRGRKMIKDLRDRIDNNERVCVKDCERVTGFMESLVLAIPAVRVWTAQIYRQTNRADRHGWDYFLADDLFDEELEMLDILLTDHNGAPISALKPEEEMWFDAGETGAGVHGVDGVAIWNKCLPDEEVGKSSTRREMKTLELMLMDIGETVCKKPQFIFDSKNTVQIMTRGRSKKPELQEIVKSVYILLTKLKITPVYKWIPREENKRADELSKRWDKSWVLKEYNIYRIRRKWGNGVRIVCIRFNSIGGYITRRKKMRYKERVILVVPYWTSQSWWPVLVQGTISNMWLGKGWQVFTPLWREDPIGTGAPPWKIFAVELK
jgi:hypothetical protein